MDLDCRGCGPFARRSGRGSIPHGCFSRSCGDTRRLQRRARRFAAAPAACFTLPSRLVPRPASGHVADRAGGDRRGHGVVGRRSFLRTPRLGEAACGAAPEADARGTVVPRRRNRAAVRDGERRGDDAGVSGPAAARLAVHQGQGFSRDDHPEKIRRQGILRHPAFAGDPEARDPMQRGYGARHGAQFTGTRRAAAPLRHRGAEKPLPAAPGERARNPLFRPHQSARGLRRRVDSGFRHRVQGDLGRPRSARHARHLGKALHHAGSHFDAARARLPAPRPGPSARKQGRHRNQLRARAHRHAGRQHRPPAQPSERGVPERPELGQGRVHADRLDHRRAEDGGPGLEDADGVPRRGTLDLAALLGDGLRKLAARATGAYARVRSQFKTPIGKFEGIEEALARIGGNLYTMDAARTMTAGAVDLGEKPSVISAIVKYHLTERGRAVVNDAMDILGGKGICLGPNNFMGRIYQQLPIAITVEGANILTRNLIVFGQGAIRCHPYGLKEMNAAREDDLKGFDAALFGHIRHVISNETRAFLMAITGSRFVSVSPRAAPRTRRYYQHLTRISAALAYVADVSMLVLGGSLKRRERISARLGDVLSMLYLASTALKRFEDEGRQEAALPLLDRSLQASR